MLKNRSRVFVLLELSCTTSTISGSITHLLNLTLSTAVGTGQLLQSAPTVCTLKSSKINSTRVSLIWNCATSMDINTEVMMGKRLEINNTYPESISLIAIICELKKEGLKNTLIPTSP
jgi:hypothetical protein